MSKITITPVGTCRINTPLKRGAARYPIRLDYRRIYGFVHTSAEVVQQLLYKRGERTIPPEVTPILFRPGMDQTEDGIEGISSDLTIIEISSTKSYSVGDVAVQCNYLIQHFADFFASSPRSRSYWELARRGNKKAMKAFLDEDPVYRLYGANDRQILADVTLRMQSFDEILKDMTTVADLVGKDRLLFVTHVNVTNPDGSMIASRDKLIRWVKSAAAQLDVECFDPTELMLEFGQERAMERGGLDSTHFTNVFSDAWFAKVQRDFVLPRFVGADVDAEAASAIDGSILYESIAAAIDHDDFFDGTRQLFAALKAHPDNIPLKLLHGQVLARIGDYESAGRLLSRHVAAPEMTHEMRQALMRVMIETGDPEGALDLATQMITDEYQNVEIYETAGRASEQLGRLDEAVRYRKLAFRLDPSNSAAAIWVLERYHVRGEAELYQSWLGEVLAVLQNQGDTALARELAEWAIQHSEQHALSCALGVLAHKDSGLLPALIDEITRVGMQDALKSLATMLVDMPGVSAPVVRSLRALGQTWVETAQKLLAAGHRKEAHSFAAATIAVQPSNREARAVQRTIIDELWTGVQNAKDDAEILSFCEPAGDLIYGRRSIAILFGRALVREGRVAEAFEVARRLYLLAPDELDACANLAHVAALNGDFRTALEIYAELAAKRDEKVDRYQARIGAFLSTAGPKGLRHIRTAVSQGRFEEAVATFRLVEQHTDLSKEQLRSELARMLSSLRAYMRRMDEDEGSGNILNTVKLMLTLAPEDGGLLRRAAMECMKIQDFDQAKDFWSRLQMVAPDLKSASQNVQRCEILAQRQKRKSRAARSVSSLAA